MKEDLKTIFERYGADYESTMRRFMENEAIYIKILDMLFRDENLGKLKDAIEKGDIGAAFEAAHTLKGVVGNLGLTPLFNAVCAIVEPLRSGERRDDYLQLCGAVEDEFLRAHEFLTELRNAGCEAD